MRTAARTLLILTGILGVANATDAGLVSTWIGPPMGDWNLASNWDNGVPGTTGVTDAVIPAARNAITVTLNMSPTLDSLTLGLGATLLQPNGRGLTLTGLSNDGLWGVTSTGSYTQIQLVAPTVGFAGQGTVVLSGVNARIVGQTSVRELRNESGHSIVGHGAIGANAFLRLTNLGTIAANVAGNTLEIDPANATDNANAGVLKATNGGLLELRSLPLDNTGVADEFGWSVAVSDDTAVVGAHYEDSVATGVDGD